MLAFADTAPEGRQTLPELTHNRRDLPPSEEHHNNQKDKGQPRQTDSIQHDDILLSSSIAQGTEH